MIGSNVLSIPSLLANQVHNEIATKGTYIGIDFGTSTTVVSIATLTDDESIVQVNSIPLKQLLEDGTLYHADKIPTVLAWYNKHLLVGEGASNLKYILTKGKNIWYSFKMELGEDTGTKYYTSELKDIAPFKIRTPKDCARVFFMYIKILLDKYCEEHQLSKNISYAVSIPASFEANQRKELMEALETNGMTLSKQSLIDEPNAAFISYIHESYLINKPLLISPHYNSKCLVFDFGGGTCDISILEIGKGLNGLYSKNIAISKFLKLGGVDIDRYITYHYLLPRFLEHNNHKMTDFLTQERLFIATQLYKIAEQLKIMLSKKLINLMCENAIPSVRKESTTPEKITFHIEIETTKGYLSQSEFYLTPEEFTKVMSIFTKESSIPTQIKGEDEYNNIFLPIKDAIRKAKIDIEELTYVLLIGGSAQNPYIQEALYTYFPDSKILIPQDLQTHVSQGAAIHSLLLNSMNKCIIQPITSEPIFVITKDINRKILIPAGTIIPTDTILIDDLVTTKDKQDAVELPLCVGNENKMLFNLKITRAGGFPINVPVRLGVSINADKMLLAVADCMGVQCTVEPQNPFANKELTTEERIVLIAERQLNIEADQNGGIPTKQSLINLREAYEKAGNDFLAAETYERQLEHYPDVKSYNAIGVLYHNSGNKDKAIEFYERALKVNPHDFYPTFNLGHTLMDRNPAEAEKLLRNALKMDSKHAPTLITLARIEQKSNNKDVSKEYQQQAYDILYKKWKTNTLSKSDYSWLISVAEDLGKFSIAQEVRQSRPTLKGESYYDSENLTRTKSLAIDKQ